MISPGEFPPGNRDVIDAVAQACDWVRDPVFTGRDVLLRRGDRFVQLLFRRDGTLHSARNDRRVYTSDKVANVLRYLREGQY